MKTNISYIGINHFPFNKILWWIFYFKKYKFIKGFNLRMFGLHFNIREDKALEKLLSISTFKEI